MKSSYLAPLLIDACHVVEDPAPGKGYTKYILLYEGASDILTQQALSTEIWSEALDLWASLEPEDLPRHIAQHPVLNTDEPGWSKTSIEDDIVTLAAQAYLEGI